MYKDKPYSYATSQRHTVFYRRRRVIATVIVVFLALAYWVRLVLVPSEAPEKIKSGGTSTWTWLSGGSGVQVTDWDDRRERVKEAFMLSWDGYEQYAWGT